jgi:hypothetical protein
MPNKSALSYVAAFKRVIRFFSDRNHSFSDLICSNESSAEARALFRDRSNPISIQFAPPSNHRSNPAERSIRTFKNHFTSILVSVHPHFPLDLWDLLLPYAEMTLNHLRPYQPNPVRSAYHGMYGEPVDFAAHPLHPPGQLVVVHEHPDNRASWAPHGLRGFYLGPSLEHYRCHLVHVLKTSSIRVSDTIACFPNPLFHFESPAPLPPAAPVDPSRPNPTADGSDLIGQSFLDPELGACVITHTGPPHLVAPGAVYRRASVQGRCV